ncbi:MAG TPA: hypothetical protein VFD01_10260 [Candidatus Dormibacteraeota bacterium]|nr:hypothetical protein [Candidatus Dormibacteraeota bacterium]
MEDGGVDGVGAGGQHGLLALAREQTAEGDDQRLRVVGPGWTVEEERERIGAA